MAYEIEYKVKRGYFQFPITSPDWRNLRNGDGKHLIFGSNPHNSSEWETVDLPFNLISDEWPWRDVAAIHCISMLYQWSEQDGKNVLQKSWNILRGGGVLWLGERERPIDIPRMIISSYTLDSLKKICEEIGFMTQPIPNATMVTGRPLDRGFALKCVK